MDQGNDSSRIEDLRRRLCDNYTVSFFENAKHLETLVTAAVSKLQTHRRAKASVAIHVLSTKSSVPHWSDAAEVKFSITNLTENAAKLARLGLQVLKRTPIRGVAFHKAGAPVREFQLEAVIGDDDEVDLLKDLDTQFILPPESSDAFNLALRGPGGIPD
jgi:hypothetical protein